MTERRMERGTSGEASTGTRLEETLLHGCRHGGMQEAQLVLFLLDLAATNLSFVELAESAAQNLAATWGSFSSAQISRRAGFDLPFTHEASEAAFTLAAAWKATQKEMYRSVGLRIIRSVAGARRRESALTGSGDGSGVATRAGLE